MILLANRTPSQNFAGGGGCPDIDESGLHGRSGARGAKRNRGIDEFRRPGIFRRAQVLTRILRFLV